MNSHLKARGQVYKQSPPLTAPVGAVHPKENFPLCVRVMPFIALSKWESAPDHARSDHISRDEKDRYEYLTAQNITHSAAARATVKTSGEMH